MKKKKHRRFDVDLLVGIGYGNKQIDKIDMRLFKEVHADFVQLKGLWGKAFFIFLLERAFRNDLKICGKKLHLDMKLRENAVYERYMKHHMTDLKRDFLNGKHDTISDNITDSMVTYGNTEFILLNKAIYNCTDEYEFKSVSYTLDMRNLIQQSYK